MEASHKTHRPHIKVGKDEEEEEEAVGPIHNNNGRNGIFLRGWLPHRGKAQMACNYEDNVLNKLRMLMERHVQMRKPYQSPGRMKNKSYYMYIAPVGD